MAIGPVITRGLGTFGTAALVITAGYSSSIVLPPDVPGLEYTAPTNRLHYTAPDNRLHFTAPTNRLHYTAPEED